MSSDPSVPRPGRGLLVSTAAVALVTGVCAFGLAHRLARTVESPGARLAALPPGIVDPDVTGSIGGGSVGSAARSVVLDPCNGNRRLVVRGP